MIHPHNPGEPDSCNHHISIIKNIHLMETYICQAMCVGACGCQRVCARCVQGVLCQRAHVFFPNLPNFVMIQSAPHLPLAAGIEQTKKAKKKKNINSSRTQVIHLSMPLRCSCSCVPKQATHLELESCCRLMPSSEHLNAEVDDTVNTIKKIITAPAQQKAKHKL